MKVDEQDMVLDLMSEPTTNTRKKAAPVDSDTELRQRVHNLRLDGPGTGKSGGGKFLNRIALLPWILCGLMAITWASFGIRGYRGGPASSPAFAPASNNGGSSSTSTPSSGSTSANSIAGTIELTVKGYLVPARQIAVSPIDVGGRIIELNVVEGKLYKKGDMLAVLESVSYDAAVSEAKAALAASQSRLKSAEMQLKELQPESVRPIEVKQLQAELNEAEATKIRNEKELERLKSIGVGSVAVPIREYQQAEADVATSAARVQRLKATLQILEMGPRQERIDGAIATVNAAIHDVQGAEARLNQAEWRLKNCTIRAPIDGTVLTKKSELFSLVNPMAFGATAGVCDIADLSDLEVDLEIAEKDINKLKVNQKCKIRADAYSDRQYDGYLDRIMPIANRAKSIVNVRVKVTLPKSEVPGTYLKPEMGAVVSFLANEPTKAQ